MIDIRELRGADTEQIASFLSSQTGSSTDALRKRLAWLLRNPALKPDIPFGIVAFRDTCLRGVMMCAPHRFREGCVTRTCLLSILFYVDRDARGAGLPVFLKFRALASQYPYIRSHCQCRRQSDMVATWWNAGGRVGLRVRPCLPPPCRSWRQPVAILSPRPSDASSTPDETIATQAGCSQETGQYEIVRDVDFFRWKIYEAGEKAYAYRFGDSRRLCVFQHSRRGYRQQIACTEIADLCGNLATRDVSDFLRSVRQAFPPDLIMFRGCSRLAGIEALAQKFKKRGFVSPTAWLIDPNRLLDGRFGYSPLAGE